MQVGKDEWTVLMRDLAVKTSPAAKAMILKRRCNELKVELQDNIAGERQYDGDPMKSPSKDPRPDGKFAKSYKWRYLETRRHMTKSEAKSGRRKTYRSTSFVQGKATDVDKVQGRVPVDANSKQLNFSGDTRKGIDILSVSSNRGTVGPKTGHSRRILSFHNATRRPVGISNKFAEKAQKRSFSEMLKGIR